MALHEVLATRSDEVMARWHEVVRGTLAPESMPQFELLDHLPEFLEEIIAALREDAGAPPGPRPEVRSTASGHGEQRLRLGFSLDSVVREYGTMRDAIIATARAADAEVTFREMQIVFDCSIEGIARAVSQYSQQRDAEMLRHANEHFAFIAHELRNPLSSAMTAFHLLSSKGQLPTEGRAAGALQRGLQRTSELIDQTLMTARMASGIELRRQPTLLSALIKDVEIDSLSDAEAKNIEVRVAIAADQELSVDVRLVRSALGNLVRNAVKYSHTGEVVEVRGSVVNERVVVEIEDGCGGLAPGMVESAFAPFVRIDTKEGGFGLGLAIAKQAVDAHGGSIRIQNLPGKGCIFALEFPIPATS
jgi:signal transduction histidine kinase